MKTAKVLLLKGGGGKEHEVSLRSAKFFADTLASLKIDFFETTVDKNNQWLGEDNSKYLFDLQGKLRDESSQIIFEPNYCIPCFHGVPGETGEIAAVLKLAGIPYLGCHMEAHSTCFNKATTKLWLDRFNIPNTPFIIVDDINDERIEEFWTTHQDVFVKASSQGSSVGCYHVSEKSKLKDSIKLALELSPFALLEKNISSKRELEISIFEYNGKIEVSKPCEIHCPNSDGFYDYDQKYSESSQTTTELEAKLEDSVIKEIQDFTTKTYQLLKLKDLSRFDYFLCQNGAIYLNEVNTFPGMTSISMFPKMMENTGVKFSDFLNSTILTALN